MPAALPSHTIGMALAAPWRPGLLPHASIAIQLAPRGDLYTRRRLALGPTLGFQRRGSGVRQTQQRRPQVYVAAASAAGTLDDSFSSVLRRRIRPWLSSPHDKEIWAVSLPALVAMLLEPVMNALNAGLVGHLGTQQLSAVSLGNLAVSLCTFFYTFLLFLTVPDIAAAVVRKDDDEVSCIAAKSLWIAAVCGSVSAAAMYNTAGAIVGVLNPPEAAVAAYAVDYIKIRSLGIPAVLLGFVATGVFRGFKDTRTPMIGAVVSAVASLGLNYMFLYMLQLGVTGSAVATAAAQGVSCLLLLTALLRGGRVFARHLSRPPSLASMLPTIKLGAVLGARNIVSMGMVIYASALSIRIGSVNQASFEVIRQIWILAIQSFECLNVATQALCASYIGKEDRATARSLLERLVVLGFGIGGLAGAAVWLLHQPLIAFFTSDPRVVAQVLEALPMLCLFFPLDAVASIMDGSLLAAKQSNYMSVVQVAGSVVQYFVLAYLAASGNVSTLTVWAALKIIVLTRVFTGAARNYFSPKSAYVDRTTSSFGQHRESVAAAAGTGAVGATYPTSAAAAAAAATPSAGPGRPHASVDLAAGPPGPSPILARPSAVLEANQAAVEANRARMLAAGAEPSGRTDEPDPAFVVQGVPSLQSIEDDVMVLACAAATSATDMKTDLLSLKRQQGDGSGGGSALRAATAADGDRGGNCSLAAVEEEASANGTGTVTPTVSADGFVHVHVTLRGDGSGSTGAVVSGRDGDAHLGVEGSSGGGPEGGAGGGKNATSAATAAEDRAAGAAVSMVQPVR